MVCFTLLFEIATCRPGNGKEIRIGIIVSYTENTEKDNEPEFLHTEAGRY